MKGLEMETRIDLLAIFVFEIADDRKRHIVIQ